MKKPPVYEHANVTISMVSGARKDDAGKLRLTLLPWEALNEVARVLDFGARKYAEGAWRDVPNGERRYIDAAFRHLSAYVLGERVDPESGLPTLAHAGCCVLFALALSAGKAS